MAVPSLITAGGLAQATSGNLGVSIPSTLAGDIVFVTTVAWHPNSSVSMDMLATPTDYNGGQDNETAYTFLSGGTFQTDGIAQVFWRRMAADTASHTLTLTRPANWDTGNDGIWVGRAYVWRDCVATGTPWESFSRNFAGGNSQQLGGMSVFGTDRRGVWFWLATSATAVPSTIPSGYAASTSLTTTTGTDAGARCFFYATGLSAAIGSSAVTYTAPAAGFAGSFGFMLMPAASGTPHTVNVDDSVTMSDDQALVRGLGVVVGDTVGLSDALDRLLAYERTVGDSLSLSDALALDRTLLFADTLGLSDNVLAGILKLVDVNDTVGLADAIAFARLLSISDPLALADALEFVRSVNIAVNDTVGLSDAVRFDRGIVIAETLALADALALARELRLSDTASVTDLVQFSRGVFLGDTVGLSDEATPQLTSGGVGHTAEINDDVTMTDALAFDRAVVLADSVTLADGLSFERTMQIAEALSLADQISFQLGITLADTLFLADNVDPVKETEGDAHTVSVDDTISLADALAFVRDMRLSEAIVIQDSNARQLNGLFLPDGTPAVRTRSTLVIGRF